MRTRTARFIARLCALLTLPCLALGQAASPSSAPSSADEARVLALLRPARTLAQQGKLTDAARETLLARQQVAKLFGRPDHWAAAYALDDLARYRRAQQDFAGAYQASEDAASIAMKEFGKSARAAYFAENHSLLSYAAGHCNEAVQSAAIALDGYLASGGRDGADTRRSATSLINLRIQRNEVDAANAVFRQVFDEAKSSSADVPTLLLRARLALSGGNLADSASWLDRADAALRGSKADAARFAPGITLMRAQLRNEAGDLSESQRLIDSLLATPNLQRDHRSEWLLGVQQRARIQGYKGLYSDALAGYTTAFNAYSREFASGAPPLIGLGHNLGWVYKGLGDRGRAEIQLNEALKQADVCYGPVNSWSLNILLERTRLLLELGRFAEAMNDAQRAVRDSESVKVDRNILKAYALESRALARRRLGLLSEASADTQASLDLLRAQRGDKSWDLVPAYTELADIALLQGDFDSAQKWAETGLAIRERDAARSMWASGLPLAQLIDVAAARKRWDRVDTYGAQLVDIVQHRLGSSQARSDTLVSELRRSRELIERLLNGVAQMPAATFAATDRLPLVFAAAQLPHLTELTAALQVNTDDRDQNKAAQNTLAKRRKLLEELQTLQTYVQEGPSDSPLSAEAMQKLLRRSAEVELQLERTDADLRRQSPQLADLLRPSLESVREIQALLGPHEALYLQVVTDTATHGVLLRTSSASFRSAPLTRATVRRNVNRLRRALDLSLPIAQRLPFDTDAAYQLYAGTLEPFRTELAGATDLIMILDDAFQNLPPGVLVTSKEKPAEARGTKFLLNQFAIAAEPSVSSFRILRARPQNNAVKPFVGFGNPTLTGATTTASRSATPVGGSAQGGLADLRALSPLPETEEELTRIASTLAAGASSLHTQKNFTEASVKRLDLSEYAVVSFATHGLLAGEFRGLRQPALVVTPPSETSTSEDGLLTASEIAGLHLRAQLVLLSACNTGRTDDGGGAVGLSALARAFFFAGADALLVSHWAVSSTATVALVTEALRLMSSDRTLTKSQALRLASLHLMQGSAGEQFRDPAYWAPFVLVGDARPLNLPKGNTQ